MKGSGALKWGVVVCSILLLAAFGCGKKEMVKSTDSSATGMGAAQPDAAGKGPEEASRAEGIVSETLKPEAGARDASTAAGTQTAMAAAAEAAAGVAATQEKASPFQDIYFDYDKAFLREDAKQVLAKVAGYLKDNSGAKLLIEGHCDERGTPEYNMALGERRAESARSYLVSLGVKNGALATVSFGEEKPAVQGSTEDAWAKNRRDHFVPN